MFGYGLSISTNALPVLVNEKKNLIWLYVCGKYGTIVLSPRIYILFAFSNICYLLIENWANDSFYDIRFLFMILV